jgi:hypothetical protein
MLFLAQRMIAVGLRTAAAARANCYILRERGRLRERVVDRSRDR